LKERRQMPDREVLVGELKTVSEGQRGASEVLVYTVVPKGSKFPKSIVWWDDPQDAPVLNPGVTYAFHCETKPTPDGTGKYWNLKGAEPGSVWDEDADEGVEEERQQAKPPVKAVTQAQVEGPKPKAKVIEDMTTAPANSLMQAVEILKHGLNVDEVRAVAVQLYALLDDLRCEKPAPSEMEQLAVGWDEDLQEAPDEF
jgi:hypothetical protein